MSVSYDMFVSAFIAKITEYNLPAMDIVPRTETVDNYMHSAMSNSNFKKVCQYPFSINKDNQDRVFNVDIPDDILIEIIDIVSEGMIVQWLKPYMYSQELLENALNIKDFSVYSPANLLSRISDVHKDAQKNYLNMIREYSFNHGDLTDLHL